MNSAFSFYPFEIPPFLSLFIHCDMALVFWRRVVNDSQLYAIPGKYERDGNGMEHQNIGPFFYRVCWVYWEYLAGGDSQVECFISSYTSYTLFAFALIKRGFVGLMVLGVRIGGGSGSITVYMN